MDTYCSSGIQFKRQRGLHSKTLHKQLLHPFINKQVKWKQLV